MNELWKALLVLFLFLMGLVGLAMSVCGGGLLVVMFRKLSFDLISIPFLLIQIACIAVGSVMLVSAAIAIRDMLGKR